MRIQSIRLHPFAGQTDMSVKFSPGLNVVSGPNEAGKSTLLNALKTCLLKSIKIGKLEWKKEMIRFMPLDGGDTIRLSLEFSEGGEYELMKSWGGNSNAYLKMPKGEVLEDPSKIESRMADLLELKPGTWRNVLFADQSNLTSTLADLNPDGEEFGDLASWLRRTAFDTDGISIEELGESISNRIQAYEDHWDVSLSRPEKNRGIDNPWEMKVGAILKAWYALQRIRYDHEQVEAYEHQLDRLTAKINACIKKRDRLSEFVDAHAPAIKDAGRRAILEANQRALVVEGKGLKKISLDWPKLEERQSNLEVDLVKTKKQISECDTELKVAEAYEKNRSRRERLKRAEAKLEQVKGVKKDLDGIEFISDKQIDELKSLDEQRARLEAGLTAGKLKLNFSTKKSLDVSVISDLEDESERNVKEGEAFELEAGGRIVLRHDDWEMVVQSGEIDLSEVRDSYQSVEADFKKLLKAVGEKDLKSAILTHGIGKEKKREQEGLNQQLKEILDGESLEDLKKSLGGDDVNPPSKSTAQIAASKARLEASVESIRGQLAQIEKQVAAWIEDYESQDHLLDILVEKRGDLKGFEKQLAELKPLPEGIGSAEEFIADFHQQEEELKRIREHELNGLKLERAQLEGESPERNLKDLEEALVEAEAALDHVQTEWKALLRIQEVYLKLCEDMDKGTLDPWMKNLKSLSESLSGGRYEEVSLEEAFAGRSDGDLKIPYLSLSTGTRACLGLAVRLSMAQHFLEARDGFVILDDPMVDLDPVRQKAASLILQEFAKDKQLIVLTCHPQHAELMGGHLIELGAGSES